ncbi:uncharacterized protein N7482_001532 [Penicillium canariense]|uniref:Uncharacterized protein n=1 Tax=Penicillium canariense TaxID=189055 RepID=A0A9W9LTM9_9EURO|nr:uncharacterized protein N7482_001532 [Penicillium canariense]KAJ5175655.1 hypothetical protein N7482_001532 [Penicillium canariense]
MLQWHEGVAKRLEYDYVKRNVHRASPPSFGAYHYHFSGKDPLPDEEDYFSHPPRRSESRRHTQYDSDRPSRRKSHRRRMSTDDYHASSSRRPDGGRSGVSSPRVQSPGAPPGTERPPRSRGRDHPAWYSHPLSPGMEDAHSHDADASEHSPRKDAADPLPKHRSRHHNLSPPPDTGARRHSHDSYMRKPYRDLSPTAPRRSHVSGSHEPRSSKSSKSRREARSRSRPAPDVQFRKPIFDGPVWAPAPEPPQYSSVPPPRAAPRPRFNLDPEDTRRGSYSGGSPGGSRPGSGGSSSERPRSYSSAGFHSRPSRCSPVRSSAAKRYMRTPLAEDSASYNASPSRRTPLYD